MGEEGPQDGASALDRPLAGKAHAHEKEKVLLLCTRGVTFRWVKGGKPFGRKTTMTTTMTMRAAAVTAHATSIMIPIRFLDFRLMSLLKSIVDPQEQQTGTRRFFNPEILLRYFQR